MFWLCLVVSLLVLSLGGNKTEWICSSLPSLPCYGDRRVLRHRTSQKYKNKLETPAGRKIISKIGSDLVVPSSHAVKSVTAQIEQAPYTSQSRRGLCFMGRSALTLTPSEFALVNSLIDRPCGPLKESQRNQNKNNLIRWTELEIMPTYFSSAVVSWYFVLSEWNASAGIPFIYFLFFWSSSRFR
jgi:hypothetical protein